MNSPIERKQNDDTTTYPMRGEGNQIPAENCNHIWISNSGQGGNPVFKRTPFSTSFSMHIKCSKCNARTWKTKEQWEQLGFVEAKASYPD